MSSPKKLIIAYGSEKGTAESIARRIYEDALNKNYPSHICSLNGFEQAGLISPDNLVVIVLSTTGNGDFPENSEKFWRFIKLRIRPADLCKGMEIAVLGLGDTNYDKFNYPAKDLERRLVQLGATRFLPIGLADDATSLEETIEPWLDKLTEALAVKYGFKGHEVMVQPSASKDEWAVPVDSLQELPCFFQMEYEKADVLLKQQDELQQQYFKQQQQQQMETHFTEEHPFIAKISGAKYLTSSTHDPSDKQVLHLELSLEKSNINFKPGDAIGVKCLNPEELIRELLSCTKFSDQYPNQNLITATKSLIIKSISCSDEKRKDLMPSHIKTPASLFSILQEQVDFFSITVNVPQLRMLAQYCSDPNEKQELWAISTKQQLFYVNITEQSATVFDILKRFKSCKPPLEHLFQASLKLQPRYFSISNSPLKHPNEAHLCATLVKYKTPIPYAIEKYGLCTNYTLHRAAQQFWLSEQQVFLKIFLRRSPEFSLPPNLPNGKQPHIIMIGPGAGIAPFRGFLQHRLYLRNESEDVDDSLKLDFLLHGCQFYDKDFLYREELLQCAKRIELLIACSRSANEGSWYGGVYVQDLMREYGSQICNILVKKGGYLYVCGDAQGMAKQVFQVLRELLEENEGMTPEKAQECLEKWRNDGHYQMDVWT